MNIKTQKKIEAIKQGIIELLGLTSKEKATKKFLIRDINDIIALVENERNV